LVISVSRTTSTQIHKLVKHLYSIKVYDRQVSIQFNTFYVTHDRRLSFLAT